MLQSARQFLRLLLSLETRLERLQVAIGRIEARQLQQSTNVADSDFGVFSQFGEDGIIQQLVRRIAIPNRLFVEFGVESYRECNTRFLLVKDYWSGLVLDASDENIAEIRNSSVYWHHRLAAKRAFIDAGNINALLADSGVRGDIGLLSIDIDGNDYWVWKAIDVVTPRIVVVEYNSLFGAERAVTVPYDPSFQRGRAHPSNLYYGASIAAFVALGRERGYTLVASNQAGNNLFFVRDDVRGDIAPKTAAEAWRCSSFRESRDAQGALTFLPPAEALATIDAMPLVDVDSGQRLRVADLPRAKTA